MQNREELLEVVYEKADKLMAYLGLNGEVTTQDDVAEELLTALNQVDEVSPKTDSVF